VNTSAVIASSDPLRKNPRANDDRLLTAEDLAERWQLPGVRPATAVYRLAREGVIPVVRIGRYYRFRLAAIEAFEAAGGVAGDG
jgi:excisionase family DNA binding protein